jgi:hypothetical protein
MTLNQQRLPQIPLPCSPSDAQCFTCHLLRVVATARRILPAQHGRILRALFSPASNYPTAQTATWPDEAFDFAPISEVPFSHDIAHNSSLPLVCATAGDLIKIGDHGPDRHTNLRRMPLSCQPRCHCIASRWIDSASAAVGRAQGFGQSEKRDWGHLCCNVTWRASSTLKANGLGECSGCTMSQNFKGNLVWWLGFSFQSRVVFWK